MTTWFVPKDSPRVYEFRKWLSFKIVKLARRVYPPSEAVLAYHMSVMQDMMIRGKSTTRIDPLDCVQEPTNEAL